MSDKISIIIPIYNVEKYLRECLDSIINQTYQNLEIILIDDGSPDQCGDICDQYAAVDARIKVIHKQNGGLSDARNTGLDICTGDWISFVDSDDYISPCFIEVMYKSAIENGSEISALYWMEEFWDQQNYRPKLDEKMENLHTTTISAREALELMFYRNISLAAQTKLCRRDILNNIRFPFDYHYEDFATTYKEFLHANRVTIIHNKLYAYRLRADSITHQDFSEKKLSVIKICDELPNDPYILEWGLKDAATVGVFGLIYKVFLQVQPDRKDIQKIFWEKIIQNRESILCNKSKLMFPKYKYGAYLSFLGMDLSHSLGRRIWTKRKINIH